MGLLVSCLFLLLFIGSIVCVTMYWNRKPLPGGKTLPQFVDHVPIALKPPYRTVVIHPDWV